MDDDELKNRAKVSHVGIALYEKGRQYRHTLHRSWKNKTYIEMGFAVVMTNTSAIVQYIPKYDAGELMNEVSGKCR